MYSLGIAEDETKILNGLCKLYPWNSLGFEIKMKAANGQEMLNYLNNNHLDVILSDISMPVLNGIELAREIQQKNLDTIVIFLSGYADFQYARQAIRYNVYEYILKPVKSQELINVFTQVRDKLDIYYKDCTVEKKNYYTALIEKINHYTLSNLADANLKNAADYIGISASYLSSIYKQYAEKNYSEFILEEKMKRACKLLNDGILKTYQIADQLGYDDPKNFTRAFKNYYGFSPREYRKSEDPL